MKTLNRSQIYVIASMLFLGFIALMPWHSTLASTPAVEGCHQVFNNSLGKVLPYSSSDRCCSPGIVPDGIVYGGNGDGNNNWCVDGNLKQKSDSCGFNLEDENHRKFHIHGVHWFCDRNLDEFQVNIVGSCEKPSAQSASLKPLTQQIGAVRAEFSVPSVLAKYPNLSPPAVSSSEVKSRTKAPAQLTAATVSSVYKHSGLAPADEYFGPQKQSVLGINNSLTNLVNALKAKSKSARDINHELQTDQAAVEDLRTQYPNESWLPKLDALSAWILSHNSVEPTAAAGV